MLNPYVLPSDSRPASGVGSNVDVEEAAVIRANSPLLESWHLQGEFVHLLQGEASDGDVSGHAARVFAIGYAANFLIVRAAAIAGMDLDWFFRQLAEALERVEQRRDDDQFAAAAAGQFTLRKMGAEIAQVRASSNNIAGKQLP